MTEPRSVTSTRRRLLLLALATAACLLAEASYALPDPVRDRPQQLQRSAPQIHHHVSAQAVATLDGSEILGDEVAALVGPRTPWIGAQEPADPRDVALRKIVRARLFAQEAKNLGVHSAHSNALLARAELARSFTMRAYEEAQLTLDEISDREARSYYERHRPVFHEVEAVHLSVVIVDTLSEAKKLVSLAHELRRSPGRLQSLMSRHRSNRELTVDAHNLSHLPVAVARTAMWMRRQGALGIARVSDSYYVLRSNRIVLHETNWSPALALRVKNYLLQEKRDALLEEIEGELLLQSDLSVNRVALSRIDIPTWAQYANRV